MRGTQQQKVANGNDTHLRQTASQPERAVALEGLLPRALAVQPHAVALMPPVEAQLWQQHRQKLLPEAVRAAAE